MLRDRSFEARVRRWLVPRARLTMHLPIAVGDYVDFYSRCTTPRTSADPAPGHRGTAAQLAPPPRRLPRPGRHGRGVGDRHRAAARARADRRRPTTLRADAGARHRARGRRVVGAGRAGRPHPVRPTPTEHVFGAGAAQRLERPATSRPTSTSRSARTSARASPRRSRRGSSRSTRSNRSWSAARRRTRRRAATCGPTRRGASTSSSRCELRRRRCEPACTALHATFADMYWTVAQQLAHLTVNGATTRPGDLFGSGTVSGPDAGERGQPDRDDLARRRAARAARRRDAAFLADGDTVTLRGWCGGRRPTRVGLRRGRRVHDRSRRHD